MFSPIMICQPMFSEHGCGTIMVWAVRQGSQFGALAGVSESNWRRGRDSNPRYPLRYVRFRGGSFQPLTHLSGLQLSAIGRQLKQIPRYVRNDKRMGENSSQRLTTNDQRRL